jgi:hypothetical protein
MCPRLLALSDIVERGFRLLVEFPDVGGSDQHINKCENFSFISTILCVMLEIFTQMDVIKYYGVNNHVNFGRNIKLHVKFEMSCWRRMESSI